MKSHARSVRLLVCAALAILLAPAVLAQDDDFLKFKNEPTFDTTSSDPVLLRYRLKAGQVLKIDMDMDMDMVVRQGGQTMKMKQIMKFKAKAAVTAVDSEGNISAVVKITRFQMKMSGMADIDVDSDKPEGMDENFKPLMAMINVGIPCKMSPIGKMLETDLEPMRLAMRRAGNAALSKIFEDSTGKMVEGTFVELSVDPVKAGDTYKAGTIVEDQMKMKMSYKVKSVSGNKKQVLLQPIGELEFDKDAFDGADVKFEKKDMAGWILFDLEKGFATKAEVRLHMIMEMSQGGQTATSEVKSKMTLTQRLAE